ncbi:helix-turn-helix transcriptional regulator [Paracoccus sulfuroxidans]|uniref:DNA-binding CsgD family transcriptional regulator n=1 Tax=Paracoccus sulfuroxidans TaxID=384678 RepID=A0A562NHD5_9RHOB|nr:LuxR C-terminal-related transcriptional regulator [Paracoccus sulfuroxidans]TWI31514.1 DNA-binding CsgD family transcriptional regulator [Paracoccus sulfuroxidans]
MQDLLTTPPSRKQLKEGFLDRFRRDRSASELNCVAHMILVIEDPEELAAVALDHLIENVGVCRVDLGFAQPRDRDYAPIRVHYNRRTDPPRCDEASYPNQAYVFRRAWHGARPVSCDEVALHPFLNDCRNDFTSISSKSILFQRLTYQRRPVGLMCMDFTRDIHAWSDDELGGIAAFSQDFLGPLLAVSRMWSAREGGQAAVRRPSPAELDAIRLAAQGLSCEEIAEALGKSARTIENQLRNARLSLQATNRAELIRKCELWL